MSIKGLILASSIAVVGMLAANAASAASCTSFAQGCMKNGGTKDVCYGSALNKCEQTGQYIGPYSGKVFQASVKTKK